MTMEEFKAGDRVFYYAQAGTIKRIITDGPFAGSVDVSGDDERDYIFSSDQIMKFSPEKNPSDLLPSEKDLAKWLSRPLVYETPKEARDAIIRVAAVASGSEVKEVYTHSDTPYGDAPIATKMAHFCEDLLRVLAQATVAQGFSK